MKKGPFFKFMLVGKRKIKIKERKTWVLSVVRSFTKGTNPVFRTPMKRESEPLTWSK